MNNISNSILFRDIISRFEVRNVDFLVRLIKYLANETGNLISARSIAKYIKSQNLNVSITAILNYLNYLTSAMLISNVKRSDIQGKKIFEVGEKYYFNDVGLRNAIAGFSPFDLGQIVENVVFLHLKIIGYSVLIGKQNGKEIDFIAERKGEKIYIQAAVRITEKQTMEREFGNLLLQYAMDSIYTSVPDVNKENPKVFGNYPNPFTGSTTFRYTLEESSQVNLRIFDNFGRLVAEPVNLFQIKGEKKVQWNAKDLPAGVYFFRLSAGNQLASGKIIKMD